MNDDRREETLHCATISLLAEGVAVTLFLAMLLLWFGVIGGQI